MNALFPKTFDNTYRGRRLALWLFGVLVFMKLAMSLNSIFNGYKIATSADGIPLDTYPPAAAQTFVAAFALLGLSNLIICLLCLLVLIRYRTMVPLMFALLLLEHLGKRLILMFLPIVRTGTPPAPVINLILLGLMIAGLALSLWRRGEIQPQL